MLCSVSSQIVFVALRGPGDLSDIAIDSLQITRGVCQGTPGQGQYIWGHPNGAYTPIY